MHLHYGGGFWGPVLERLLSDEVEQGRVRLLALVSRAHALKRPARSCSPRGTSKHSLSASAVSVDRRGPWARIRPSRSNSRWVNPGGISSTWWVTSTIGGDGRIGGERGERPDESFPPGEVEPGGGLVEQDEAGDRP